MLIELAGIPAEVICRFPENERFLRPYASEKPPQFTVAPSAEDLQRMQASFDRTAAEEGRPGRVYAPPSLENSAIHALLAEQLTARDVLLIHGSALCMDGEAIVFIAPSGTGKSTHARLWREVFSDRVWMINDDKPMLRIENGDIFVWGTPWNGKHHLSRNASAPLKAIVWLTRGETNHIAPMAKAEAFPILMRQCLTRTDPVVMSRIILMEKAILNAAAFYRLTCNMQPEAAMVAWDGISRGAELSQQT